MAENTNPVPPVSDGYAAEGRALEQESLASTYPTNPATPISDPATAAAGDTSEMLGEVLQSQELNPLEPAVTNDPVPLEGTANTAPAPIASTTEPAMAAAAAPVPTAAGQPAAAAAPFVPPTQEGYGAEGRAMEQEALNEFYPGQPIRTEQPATPYYAAPQTPAAGYGAPTAPSPVAASQAAYQAAYGAPSAGTAPAAGTAAPVPPAYTPQAAVTAAALKKSRESLDPRRIFLICGMAVGAIMIVFGLCMLAFYTPAEISEFYDPSHFGGNQAFANAGATAAQVLKAGFSMLLIGLGAADICAFGAKLTKRTCKPKFDR